MPSDADGGRFYQHNGRMHTFMATAFLNLFKWPLDRMDDYWPTDRTRIRDFLDRSEWYWAYDFLEFCARNYPYASGKEDFVQHANQILEREMSAYRIVDDRLVQITADEEIQAVEAAIGATGPLAGVQAHLRRALELMADRQQPDYRNAIKEAISSVGALSKLLVRDEDATLGAALKRLDDASGIHPALRDAFSKMYGYTSGEGGIRHAMIEEPGLGREDALYMIVACSAFINYALAKAAKSGISLGA